MDKQEQLADSALAKTTGRNIKKKIEMKKFVAWYSVTVEGWHMTVDRLNWEMFDCAIC